MELSDGDNYNTDVPVRDNFTVIYNIMKAFGFFPPLRLLFDIKETASVNSP